MKMTEEITIPVPWGHISGKIRGSVGTGKVVLCLHGLQDNCGSFERLLPLLPKGFQYVAIDFPGHGKSSHFQRGVPLVYMHYVFAIKLIVDYYKWDKVIFLAHSFGAQISTIFAGIYPEYCEKLILLDGFTTNMVNDRGLVKYFRHHFNDMQEVDRMLATKVPPSHSYEKALERFMISRFSKLTRESAEVLIKRSLIKSGSGVRFSTDQRLKKLFRLPMNKNHIKAILTAVECPCLLIIALETFNLFLGNRVELENVHKNETYLKLLDLAKEKPNYTFKIVDGNHDVHLNNAALVAESITPFLLHTKSSL